MDTHGSVVPSQSSLVEPRIPSRNAATAHLVRHQTVGRTLPEETPLLIEETPQQIEETPRHSEEIPPITIEETPLVKNPQWIS